MSDSAIEFIPGSAVHADILADLHVQSWRAAYRGLLPDDYLDHTVAAERQALWRARMREGKDAPLDVTLARQDGQWAGFACLCPEAEPHKGIYLDNLHVLPRFQGHGLGKRLLAHVVDRLAVKWPGRPMFLYVFDGNLQARHVYRGLGGIESEPFTDTFQDVLDAVLVRSVTWSDVPRLRERLTQPSSQ